MEHRAEYLPGHGAPSAGIYEQINVFGRSTGILVTLNQGQAFPDALIGHVWRAAESEVWNEGRAIRHDTGDVPAKRTIDHYVGDRLKQTREARGFGLAEVSSQTGIPENAIAGYERGERRVLASDIIALSALYYVTLGELFPEGLGQITGRLH